MLEADIQACFDEIDHAALMGRVRRRIKDKRVLALVRAFLKAGVLTTTGDRDTRWTGTPQGGILSPLLANIALSALDEHFARQWNSSMRTWHQRDRRRRQGLASWRLVRYADLSRIRISLLWGYPSERTSPGRTLATACPRAADPESAGALADRAMLA